MKAKGLTIARLRTLLDEWGREYGEDYMIGIRTDSPYLQRIYAVDTCDLTTKAPDYAEEIEGWGDLTTARQHPEFRANFPE